MTVKSAFRLLLSFLKERGFLTERDVEWIEKELEVDKHENT